MKLDALMPTIDREVIAVIKEIETDHGFSSGSWGFWGGTVPTYVAYHGKDGGMAGRLTISYRPEERTISIGPWQGESAHVQRSGKIYSKDFQRCASATSKALTAALLGEKNLTEISGTEKWECF
jgi:hypothetical protein